MRLPGVEIVGKERNMKIHKVINNNFVIVKDDHEMIVMGMGIGFKKKPGDPVEEEKIIKTFYLSNDEIKYELYQLLDQVPMDIIEAVENFLSEFRQNTGKDLNDTIHLSLIDHLNSAISHEKEGINIVNALLFDIKKFYPEEFRYGKALVDKINQIYDVKLPEDEAGFVALHIVNADMNGEDNHTYQITYLMKEMIRIVHRFFRVEFDEESSYYYRFTTHLKFFAHRIINKKLHPENTEEELFTEIAKMYPKVFECVMVIVKFIWKEYQEKVGEEEQLYLMIHISKLLKNAKK